MLYLVKGEVKSGYPLPPEQWLELVVKHLEELLEYKKQGKVVLHVGSVGRMVGWIIWDVDSNEELQNLVTQQPLWPFMEWEITPLISTEQSLVSVKQSLETMRG